MFWEKLSLKVDQPKQGGFGSSNVDNTARRAFNNYKAFSEITGVDIQLILNMRTILMCPSSQLPINLGKYEQLCHTTGQISMASHDNDSPQNIGSLQRYLGANSSSSRLFWRRGSRIEE